MRSPSAGADEVRRLARDLLPKTSIISRQITERVLQAVPELAPAGTPDAVGGVQESTDQNIGAMLSTLAFGITPTTVDPPTGTRDLVDNLTAGGGDLTHLLRAYRVGHELLWQLWSEHVYAEIREPELAPSVLQISSAHLFDFIDRVCERIVESTRAATSDSDRRRPETRHEVVGRLLGSDPVDLGAATATLSYDLTRHHVALLVAPLTDVTDVRRELDRLLSAAPVPALALPSGEGGWWGWMGFPHSPTAEQLDKLASVEVDGVLVGLGEPGRGREGFRRSLAQAREAERVGRLAQRLRPCVLRHRDFEIAALLCGDPDRARALAAARLGDLGSHDELGARLRATVRAFLANGHNRGRAADALHVHHKTVSYRLGQAEELLGRPLSQDTFGLEAALLVHQTLYGS